MLYHRQATQIHSKSNLIKYKNNLPPFSDLVRSADEKKNKAIKRLITAYTTEKADNKRLRAELAAATSTPAQPAPPPPQPAPPPPQHAQTAPTECAVCLGQCQQRQPYVGTCGHLFCKGCIKNTVRHQKRDDDAAEIAQELAELIGEAANSPSSLYAVSSCPVCRKPGAFFRAFV